jgi:hypothetical protein
MYSQAGQDKFVLDRIGTKGTYLEIGASHPVYINNTYLLELNGWNGLSIDIDDSNKVAWYECRNNPLIIADAITYNYNDVERIDYLQLDIEPTENTFACLQHILKTTKTRFSIITFETDAYLDLRFVKPSRDILQDLGYELIKPDVQCEFGAFEDWYIDKTIL